jgi:RHS repeat-associated protein
MRAVFLRWVTVLAGLVLGGGVGAQQLDDPVTVRVEFYGLAVVANHGYASLDVSFGAGMSAHHVHSSAYPGWWLQASPAEAHLKPGRAYLCAVNVNNVSSWQLQVVAPTGYRVWMEDVERERVDGGSLGRLVKVRIDAESFLPAGTASELRPGRVVWAVGLGALKNGRPAGAIKLREPGLSGGTYNRSALIYDHDTLLALRYPAHGPLEQILANECFVVVTQETDRKFSIAFYTRGAVQDTNGTGPWLLKPGFTPYVVYTVENPDAGAVWERLKITQQNGLSSPGEPARTSWTELQKFNQNWHVIPWNTGEYPQLPDSRTWWTYGSDPRDEYITVQNAASQTMAQTYQRYENFAWGTELVTRRRGEGQPFPLAETFAYHEAPGQGRHSRLRHVINPLGGWERYDYYEDLDRRGKVHRLYRPFADFPEDPNQASPTSGDVLTFDYAQDFTGKRTLPSSIERHINGVLAGRTQITYSYEQKNGLPILVARRTDWSSANDSLLTTTRTIRADATAQGGFWAGLPHSVQRPDGTMRAYVYLFGEFDESDRTFQSALNGVMIMVMEIEGLAQWAEGAQRLASWPTGHQPWQIDDAQDDFDFHIMPGASTMRATVYTADGAMICEQKHVFTSAGWRLVQRELREFLPGNSALVAWRSADSGDPYSSWLTYEAGYRGGLVKWERDATGIQTEIVTRDELGRERARLRRGAPGGPEGTHHDRWTYTDYNASGLITKVRVAEADSSEQSHHLVTLHTHDWAGRPTSTSTPGVSGTTRTWATTQTTYFWDGNPRITRVLQPDGAEVRTWLYRDGRPRQRWGSGTVPRYWYYGVDSHNGYLFTLADETGEWGYGRSWVHERFDWLGRYSWSSHPTTSPSSFIYRGANYNAKGQLVERWVYDQNWHQQPLVAPTRYLYDAMGRLVKEGLDLNENGQLDDTSSDRIHLYADDFHEWNGAWWRRHRTWTLNVPNSATAYQQFESLTRLTGRNATLQAEQRFRDANQQQTVVVTHLDRAQRKVTVTTTVPGSSTAAHVISYAGLTVEERSSTDVTVKQSYDALGRPWRTSGRDQVFAENIYYPGSTLVKHVTNAQLHEWWQQFEYDLAGRLTAHHLNNVGQWQVRRFAYTGRGELWRQWGSGQLPVEYEYNSSGWRIAQHTYRFGSGWGGATWPADPGEADRTDWSYHPATGLLLSVTSPHPQPEDPSPPRPVVTFTYDGANRLAQRTWARGVTTTYAYHNWAGHRTGDLWRIDYSDGTPRVEYHIADWAGTITRFGQVQRILDAAGWHTFWYRPHDRQRSHEWLDGGFYGVRHGHPLVLYDDFDPLGRPWRQHFGWGDSPAEHQRVDSHYDPATGRLSSLTAHTANMAHARTFTYQYRAHSDQVTQVSRGPFQRATTWESWRELPGVVETKWNSTTLGRFAYDHDWAGWRTDETVTGTLPATLGQTHGWKNQHVHTARGELGHTQVFALNSCGGLGDALAPRYRLWEYDHAGNRSAEQREHSDAPLATWTAGGLNQVRVAGVYGTHFTYDADGNLTADGVWEYHWDGENRLVRQRRQDNTLSLRYTYDHAHRRVRKEVFANGNWTDPATTDRRYVWRGWQLVAELEPGAPPTVHTNYIWGLDRSGTVGGAGGNGGLLMQEWSVWSHRPVAYPLYDAHGTVHGYVDDSGGLVASYAHSPFGEQHAETGWAAGALTPLRFATQYRDAETGLYYSQHRYYHPGLGRFLSRDPIGEAGGLNLYAYAGNDPVNRWDYLGLRDSPFDSPRAGSRGGWDDWFPWWEWWLPRHDHWYADDDWGWSGGGGGGDPWAGFRPVLPGWGSGGYGFGRGHPRFGDFRLRIAEGRDPGGRERANPFSAAIGRNRAIAELTEELGGVGAIQEYEDRVALGIEIGDYIEIAGEGIFLVAQMNPVVRGAVTVEVLLRDPFSGEAVLRIIPIQQLVRAAGRAITLNAHAAETTVSAATPVGRLGAPLGSVARNTPTTINGRVYTGHALDQMQARGLVPSVIEDTIAQGARSAGRDGATIFTTNQARVIVNPNGSVKTVMPQ